MTYDEQLKVQRARARMLRGWIPGRLALVRVEYPDQPPRVSIIGAAITWAAVEVWRDEGAVITMIEDVMKVS
jgi:collagenase-like PrtC family protease